MTADGFRCRRLRVTQAAPELLRCERDRIPKLTGWVVSFSIEKGIVRRTDVAYGTDFL